MAGPRTAKPTSAPVAPPPEVAPDSHLPGTIRSIQILRFLAAFSVVLFHAHHALTRGAEADTVSKAFGVGATGVHVFFVISGFVMVYTTCRSGLTPASFLSRRLIRIYPIYWLTAATYLAAHWLLGSAYRLSLTDLIGAALLLPRYSSLVIGPGWTLSYEMYFYLCFAVAICLGVRRGLQLLSLFYVGSIAVGIALDPQSGVLDVATKPLLLEFLAGCWLGWLFIRGLRISIPLGALLMLGGAAMYAAGIWLDYQRLPSVLSWGIPSVLLVAGGLAVEPLLKGRLSQWSAELGDSSYLLYLSHILILDLLLATPVGLLNQSAAGALLLALPLAIACTAAAALGYKAVELPMLNALKTRLLRGRARKLRSAQVTS